MPKFVYIRVVVSDRFDHNKFDRLAAQLADTFNAFEAFGEPEIRERHVEIACDHPYEHWRSGQE